MKKLLMSFVAVIFVGGVVFAAETKVDHKPVEHQQESKNVKPEQSTNEINIYSEANDKSKVLTKVNVSQRLVPFFNKGEWIKVGDPTNGQVGWINKDQFRKAMNEAVHRSVQTIYIEQKSTNSKKPTYTVYQNGKKITGKKAEEVYEQVQKQQEHMQKRFARFQQRMNQWMNSQMSMMNGPMMPMMQPIVIIENGSGQPAKLAPPSKKEDKK